MSVPADRMQQDSHAAVHSGIQALAGAAAKMGSAKTEPHPALMQALQSLHGKVDQLGQGAAGVPGDDQAQDSPTSPGSLPDPQDLVEQDPQMAAGYAEAIMQALASMLMNSASAPGGAPMGADQQAAPNVGGEGTALY